MDLEPLLPHHVPSDRVFDFDIYAQEQRFQHIGIYQIPRRAERAGNLLHAAKRRPLGIPPL